MHCSPRDKPPSARLKQIGISETRVDYEGMSVVQLCRLDKDIRVIDVVNWHYLFPSQCLWFSKPGVLQAFQINKDWSYIVKKYFMEKCAHNTQCFNNNNQCYVGIALWIHEKNTETEKTAVDSLVHLTEHFAAGEYVPLWLCILSQFWPIIPAL